MKTVPFNAEQAKAGRALLWHSDLHAVSLIHTEREQAWVKGRSGEFLCPTRFLVHRSYPAPGHNPAQLDEWTVGTHEGWRLLEKEEIRCREETPDIQAWALNHWEDGSYAGSVSCNTYRTRRPPGYFLPKVVTRNIRQDELPKEIIVSEPAGFIYMVTEPDQSWIEHAAKQNHRWSRSLDGPWNKFTVEEKQ